MLRASSYDREILALALPALGALAAEPLYVLADTAIVGHLGTRPLAALALAATLLTAVVSLCNFLAYATTAQVARLRGAGERERAGALAAQGLWLALGIGVGLGVLCAALAGPLMLVLGGTGDAADAAARYVRIAAIGLPGALVALAGSGFLRGVGDLRTPLVILVAANVANVALELVLVYGLDLGLDGSAAGTVVAQLGMGATFAWVLLRVPAAGRRPDLAALRRLARMGSDLVVRTGALLGAFTVASAVLARDGEAPLAAHQIAFQLFLFLALVLDAIAIAGQVITGRLLGAGDADEARGAARRMVQLSAAVGVLMAVVIGLLHAVLPRAFTSDPAVLHQAETLWPLFALLLIPGALVFALDGLLIGAGDTRYIARAMVLAFAAFAPVALASLAFSWGVVGVWAAIHVLMAVRLATMALRLRSGRWLVLGAPT